MMVTNPQAMNSLFSALITEQDKMLWVTNSTYDKEIFISSNFEEHTGIPCRQLYEDWKNPLYVLPPINPHNNFTDLEQKLKNRTNDNPSVTYCIYGKNHKQIYIKDSLLCLLNHKQDDKKMIVGVMELITQTEYELYTENAHRSKNLAFDFLFENVNEVTVIHDGLHKITESTGIEAPCAIINNTMIKLTRREAECLGCLLEGMSSKAIARKLEISPRTVEIHITNIKMKTKTASRLELISKLQNIDDFIIS